MRWPRLALPAVMPANSSGTTSIQQRHNPAHRPHKPLRLARAPVHILGPVDRRNFLRQLRGQNLRGAAAGASYRRRHILALGVVSFSSASTSTPAFFANASAAGVGAPSLKATFHEGPVSFSFTSAPAPSTPSRAQPAVAAWNRSSPCASAPSSRSRVKQIVTRAASSCLGARQSCGPESLPAQSQIKSLPSVSFILLVAISAAAAACSVCASSCRSVRLRHATARARIRPITPTRSVTLIAPRASSMLNRFEHFSASSYAASTGTRFALSCALASSFSAFALQQLLASLHTVGSAPTAWHVGFFEVVDRKLQFFGSRTSP